MDKKRLIIIDGNAVVHRAYHALPPLTTKKGEEVGAIYGFLLVFLRAIRELKPEFVVVAFDFPAPSFRHKEYKPYKATRKKAPEALYKQIAQAKKLMEDFGVKVLEKEGYEGDDIIATCAKKTSLEKEPAGLETIIISSDLDTLQAVDKDTKVYVLRKGVKDIVLYDEKLVQEKYGGLKSSQLSDFKGLRGDPSDNIPGVFGVGEKTAIELIREFGSVENLYKEIQENTPKTQKIKPVLIKKLLEYKEKAFLSKKLGKLDYNVPLDWDIRKCRWQEVDKGKAAGILRDHGFHSLISRLNGADNPQILVANGKEKPDTEKQKGNLSLFEKG